MQSLVNEIGNPRSEFFDFFAEPPVELEAEYKIFQKLSDVFILICTGVQTSRDHIAIDFSEADLINTISDFADPKMTDDEARSQYFAPSKQGGPLPGDTRQWSLSEARKKIFKDQS